MNTNNNSNNNNRNDDSDSKDMSIDIQIETNTNTNNRIVTISSNKIENTDEETCTCGDPSLHVQSCAIYCGMYPCEEELIKLPKCDHYLHKNCLETLLYTRLSKCPLCRSSIESWRRSKHFSTIEKEISKQFQSDTEQAILLSQKLFEEEQNRRTSRSNDQDGERNRERERSRSRERNRNNDRNDHRNDRNHNRNNRNNRNNDNRRVRFRSFFNRNRSRNRNHNQRHSM